MLVTSDATVSNSRFAKKAVHAVFWNYVSFGLGKLLVFVTTAILARLLTPADFGLMGFAVLAITYFSAFKDLGLGAALIQRRDNVEEAADTVFTLNLILGVLLTIALFFAAPWFASYFRQPQVIPILRVLSSSFVLNALSSVHISRLQRELDFQRKLIPDLVSSIVKGAVSIGCALANFGVWSLIVGQMASTLATMIAVWYVYPWRPRLAIHFHLAKALLRFGIPIVALGTLGVVFDSLDRLIVGRLFDGTALGLYTVAYRLPELLILNPLWVVTAAIFPVYASIQEQQETLRQSFLTTLRFIGIFIMPFGLGLILAADPLVRVAFGEQWLASIPLVSALGFAALLQSVGFHVGDIYKAIGRVDILVKLSLALALVQVPLLLLGARYGVTGVAIAMVGVAILELAIRLWTARRFLMFAWSTIFVELRPSLLSGIALTLLALPALYLTANAEPWVRLLSITIMGAIGYLGTLWLLEGKTLLQFWSSRSRTAPLPANSTAIAE